MRGDRAAVRGGAAGVRPGVGTPDAVQEADAKGQRRIGGLRRARRSRRGG